MQAVTIDRTQQKKNSLKKHKNLFSRIIKEEKDLIFKINPFCPLFYENNFRLIRSLSNFLISLMH
jgi:hypothetical protein